ncbi:MAG: Rrf2 family transcriptional regulator [Lachnospiraceae bacterium]|nr:Rrf2 family transcriptional regulator [Lachnospiraceae bacterium]
MISTRGRYALRVMIDLAKNGKGEFIPMKDVAERQGISLKYLEQILPVLSKNELVEAIHGKGGGYRLAKDPSEIKVGEVLRLTEKELAPVACLAADAAKCERMPECATIGFWKEYNEVVNKFLDSKTLMDF